jgi:hypothetical protein
MPLPLIIETFTTPRFAAAVAAFDWGAGRIGEVHWHHTYIPNHAHFRARGGERLVRDMYRYHTATRGWRHLGQHVTIDPDGVIWRGRPWNLAPASAVGHNGHDDGVHPFMFEMIGDFRAGHDALTGAQLDAALLVTAIVQRRFGLGADALRFHREMQPTSCPGDLDKADIVAGVEKMRDALAASPAPAAVPAEESYVPAA